MRVTLDQVYPLRRFIQTYESGGNYLPDSYDISVSTTGFVGMTIPFAFGIGGALWHARRDWRRFLAMFSMFLIMGLGLVVYLNMPDPEPRERDYIFVGA